MAQANENGMTVIGSDTHIKGEMTFDQSARVLGRFEGTVQAKGELHVADGASCKAQIEAATVVVDGVIEGNVIATESIQLNAKSRLTGDVAAAKLVVAEGAAISGHVSVGPDAGRGSKPAAPAKPEIETTEAAKEPAKPREATQPAKR